MTIEARIDGRGSFELQDGSKVSSLLCPTGQELDVTLGNKRLIVKDLGPRNTLGGAFDLIKDGKFPMVISGEGLEVVAAYASDLQNLTSISASIKKNGSVELSTQGDDSVRVKFSHRE